MIRPSVERLALTTSLCLLLAAAAQAASPCETLRDEIDARIRAKGVAEFRLEVVDAGAAEAAAAGRVVGHCERGARRIVYLRVGAVGAGAGATAARRDEAVLTECKDGTLSVGGNCRK